MLSPPKALLICWEKLYVIVNKTKPLWIYHTMFDAFENK